MSFNKIVIVFGLMLAVLTAAPAHAQRVYVASQGSDANNCSLQLPCRSLQHAVSISESGGEIAILNTGGYNGGTTVTIDKAISIVNQGGYEAGISFLSGVAGIVINAGPNDAVTLRGLTIEGAGVGTIGIKFNAGKSLTVKNCVVRHMAGNGVNGVGSGIYFGPSASSNLIVSDTVASDNAFMGIYVYPSGGTVSAVLNHVEANNNSWGIAMDGYGGANSINGTATDSIASSNNSAGFYVATNSGPATLTVFHSVAANNGTGLYAYNSGATLRVANSVVTGNTTSWFGQTAGIVRSYGDNYIDGNGDGDPSPTTIVRK